MAAASTSVLEISTYLSTAVRASIGLPADERADFVGRHLLAQADERPLPEAESTRQPSRATLQEELVLLAETLTNAVNAVSPPWLRRPTRRRAPPPLLRLRSTSVIRSCWCQCTGRCPSGCCPSDSAGRTAGWRAGC